MLTAAAVAAAARNNRRVLASCAAPAHQRTVLISAVLLLILNSLFHDLVTLAGFGLLGHQGHLVQLQLRFKLLNDELILSPLVGDVAAAPLALVSG